MKSKKKYRPEYSSIVAQWRKSGMSRYAFCIENNYNKCTFDGWIKKVEIGLQRKLPAKRVLVPLQIEHSHFVAPHTTFEVRYPNGVCLEMNSLPSSEDLSRIVHIYRSELCSR
ncbi:MAG: hypothetical protein WCJ61_03885 [Paludibacter sp.]